MDDLRRPTGLLFGLLGLMLLIYSLINPGARAPLDPPTNVNLWCGLTITAFGAILLWLSRSKKQS
jgi:hypothetical protein